MLQNNTTTKLLEMRLTGMADAFRIQQEDSKMKNVTFEDRFAMLVDIEYNRRKDNRLKRLIREADFEQPDACIAGIDYTSGRKLNKELIAKLATCEYITEYRNIFIMGAAGSGKTYMACAFGMAACMNYYKVRYIRLPDLLIELQEAARNNTLPKALETKLVFELIHKRRKKSSTIFCSQFLDDGWYERIGSEDNPLSDSIMDRIKYDAYKISIKAIDAKHDKSMREVYGLKASESH